MGGYIGAKTGTLVASASDIRGDISATDTTPEITLKNTTETDADGTRSGKITFKGEQSGGEESVLAQIQGSHDGTADDEKGDLIFKTNDGSDGASPTEAMRITSEQKIGIGTSSPEGNVHVRATIAEAYLQSDDGQLAQLVFGDASDSSRGRIYYDSSENMVFANNNLVERARIDPDGHLLVGKSATGIATVGGELKASGEILATVSGDSCVFLNRTSSDGTIIDIRKGGSNVGKIGSVSGDPDIFIGTIDTGFAFLDHVDSITPHSPNSNTGKDNHTDLGYTSRRWQDIYATNGTIQTSDENEKQNIASLTNAEIIAATAISKLFKTFKWKDKVAAKGDAARTHTGVVAQQVETAMSDAELDASNYAFFISTTWWEADGKDYYTIEEAPEGATERNRKGIRYPELLAFIGAATEQRLTSIESRLTALEAE